MKPGLLWAHPSPSCHWNHTGQPPPFGPPGSVTTPASLPPSQASSPFTFTQDSTTVTPFSNSHPPSLSTLASTITTHSPSNSPSSAASSVTPSIIPAQANIVCIGHGLDISATGLIATVILPSAVGLILWLVFAIIRPRFRQLYAVREWFVQQDLRPEPLRSTWWAFLFPHVPMVPSIPKDVSKANQSPVEDAQLFPADEQLTQRVIWLCFVLALGWTVLGLAGALPIYLVSTPCLAQLPNPAKFTGALSTLQDLSLLRLLHLWDSNHGSVTTFRRRVDFVENDTKSNIRIRFILLTVLTGLVAVVPAMYKILREFNRLVAYRKRWITIRCQGNEMGWLSARDAPAFATWGEQRLKNFILKTGLSSSLESGGANGNGSRRQTEQRRVPKSGNGHGNHEEEGHLEIDIQSLFSIGDTHQLALLIDERDEILENLEIAETKYIYSFRLTTPDPSIADFQPRPAPPDPAARPYISRPRPLRGDITARRRRRAYNPAYAASSLAPTSFVAPSQYYKLRNVRGVSGGRFVDNQDQGTVSDSVYSRRVGSRFQEVDRDSAAFGRLELGSRVPQDNSGAPWLSQPFDFAAADYRQDFTLDPAVVHEADEYGRRYRESSGEGDTRDEVLDEEWVNLTRHEVESGEKTEESQPVPTSSIPLVRRRPNKEVSISTGRRDTFPLRNQSQKSEVPPPHLRLQTQGPFVRPLSGINHVDLGAVYNDLSQWRSKLKGINAEIADAQRDCYVDIAEGTRIKGWLMVGRGLRFIPGIQLIEGRAKEDIRWDVLQNERSSLDWLALWTVVAFATILLAIILTAAAGLALSPAPDVAHTFSFLQPLATHNNLRSGIITTLVPALLAALFLFIAIVVVHWAVDVRGSISITGGHLLVFKFMFFILSVIATVLLVVVGALLFAIQSFDTSKQMASTVADGAIYISALLLSILITGAIIIPALLMIQPTRLWHILRAEKHAVTPRQRFRAIYPRPYDPSFATGACVLAVIFASTFSLIFPLIGPAVVILLFLTLIAHRYLVGYVYARTYSQTGGLLQIWLLRRFGTLLSLQPILMGLIFLTRRFWIEGGVLVAVGVIVIVTVETYTHSKTKLPGRSSLNAITQNSLNTFEHSAKQLYGQTGDAESSVSSGRVQLRTRGSMASVLEMMSATLAVTPSPSPQRGPVPLKTETLDDLTATERAARTHPDAPPLLPQLSFTDHAEDMAGILYAPELVAPPPIIWLPNDSAGVARSEAVDLQRYHDLPATLDVWTREDAVPRRTSLARTRS